MQTKRGPGRPKGSRSAAQDHELVALVVCSIEACNGRYLVWSGIETSRGPGRVASLDEGMPERLFDRAVRLARGRSDVREARRLIEIGWRERRAASTHVDELRDAIDACLTNFEIEPRVRKRRIRKSNFASDSPHSRAVTSKKLVPRVDGHTRQAASRVLFELGYTINPEYVPTVMKRLHKSGVAAGLRLHEGPIFERVVQQGEAAAFRGTPALGARHARSRGLRQCNTLDARLGAR